MLYRRLSLVTRLWQWPSLNLSHCTTQNHRLGASITEIAKIVSRCQSFVRDKNHAMCFGLKAWIKWINGYLGINPVLICIFVLSISLIWRMQHTTCLHKGSSIAHFHIINCSLLLSFSWIDLLGSFFTSQDTFLVFFGHHLKFFSSKI